MSLNNQIVVTARVDAAQAEASLGRLGKAADRVASEFRGAAASQTGAVERLSVAFLRQGDAAQTASSGVGAFALGIGRMAGPIAAATLGLGALTAGLVGVHAALGPAREAAGDYEAAMKTLQIVSERTGSLFSENRKLVEQFSDKISSPDAVAKAVRVFATMNLSMEEQARLITTIRDGAVGMGQDVNEALPLMALAIKRGEGELLDNIGVVSTVESMYQRYAATIGKTAAALTTQEKTQAIVNGVLREAGVYSGAAERSTETYQGSIANLAAAKRELATVVGERVIPIYRDFQNLLADTIRHATKLIEILPKLAEQKTEADRKVNNWLADRLADGVGAVFGDKAGEVTRKAFSNPGKPDTTAEDLEAEKAAAAKVQAEKAAAEAAEAATIKEGEARKAAEEEAKRLREKIASDQTNLRAKLHEELALIDKQGYEREREQARLHYQEMAALAHGNKDLLAQAARVRDAELAQINREEREEGIDKTAAQRLFNNELGKGGRAGEIGILEDQVKALQDLGAPVEGTDEKIQALQNRIKALRQELKDLAQAAKIDALNQRADDFRGASQGAGRQLKARSEARLESLIAPQHDVTTADGIQAEMARLKAEALDQQNQGIREQLAITRQLQSYEEDLLDLSRERQEVMKDLGMQALSAGAGMASQAIEGKLSGGDVSRGAGSVIGGAIGLIGGPVGVAIGSTAGGIIGDLVGSVFDRRDSDAKEAAEKQERAAELQLEAAERASQFREENRGFRDQQADRLARTQLEAELQTLSDPDKILRRADFEAQARMGDVRSWIADQLGGGSMGEGLSNDLIGRVRAGDVGGAAETYGWELASAVRLALDESELSKSIARQEAERAREQDKERALRGVNPANPLYVQVTNFPDNYAYAPEDARHRSGGPGTRRMDAMSNRAVNVGGIKR